MGNKKYVDILRAKRKVSRLNESVFISGKYVEDVGVICSIVYMACVLVPPC